MLRLKKTGQSTAEYAIVIGLVIAAAVAMQVYVKRGIQAKIRGVVDYQPDANTTILKQYEPYYSLSEMDTVRTSAGTTNTTAGGGVVRGTVVETTRRTGNQKTTAVPE
ncbi:MAG: hypothetical protein NTX01_01095 [Candidatus Omnitrophica bacterium]|nr:hypothetical protein [Candidatus Omnitrophota bacterium]